MTPPRIELPRAVRIREIVEENYRTRTLTLELTLEATPGQFVMLWLPRFDEKPLSLVDCDPVQVMISAVGPFPGLVHELAVGDRIWLRGPYGNGFHAPAAGQTVALVGGGYGVAPLLWLARTLQGRARAVHTLIGARRAADVLYAGYFETLATEPSGTANYLHLTTEDGSLGAPGRVTDPLAQLCAQGKVDQICACGPDGMLGALRDLAAQHHLPAQLSWEAYMRCAVGICGACEHEGDLLCLDGPVLRTEAHAAGKSNSWADRFVVDQRSG